jgi:small subunit ribosomal protein S21
MIIVKLNQKIPIEKALKDYKSKIIKTRQMSELLNRTVFKKKSVLKREKLRKAIYIQKMYGKKNN